VSESHTVSKQFTGKHMLLIVLGFFGAIIIANAILAYFALGSWTGLVVKNSYVASQNFNKRLERAERQQRLGITSTLKYHDGILKLTLQHKEGTPFSGLNAKIKIGRTIHENADSTIILKEETTGIYGANSVLAPGLWQAEVLAKGRQNVTYRQTFRLLVKEPKSK